MKPLYCRQGISIIGGSVGPEVGVNRSTDIDRAIEQVKDSLQNAHLAR